MGRIKKNVKMIKYDYFSLDFTLLSCYTLWTSILRKSIK